MKKKSLEELRARVEEEYVIKTRPLDRRVLVRSLGKELKYKDTIILPDSDDAKNFQHKPVYEGIVLETYKPYETVLRYHANGNDGTDYTEFRTWSSKVKVGDHVLFPHFEGYAHQLEQAHDIRFIHEDSILAVLEYELKEGEEPRVRTMSGFSRDAGYSRGN